MVNQNLRVLLVAEHASAQFGGEAALPLHYFRILRRRGIEAWMIVHERTRTELEQVFPEERDRILYVADTGWHRAAFQLGKLLPHRLEYITLGFLSRLLSQSIQLRMIRELVKTEQISVVHQPIPVSPKEPSMIHHVGVPVVMGPMNGGMEYPPAFRGMENRSTQVIVGLGRKFSNILNGLMPGKRYADILLVANQRTQRALPDHIQGQVIELVENGVDLSVWQSGDRLMTTELGFDAVRRVSPQGRFLGLLSTVFARRVQTERRIAANQVYSKYRRFLPATDHLDALLHTSQSFVEQFPAQSLSPSAKSQAVKAPIAERPIAKQAIAEQAIAEQKLVTFVYVGRLVGWKTVDCLLEAFSQIVGNLPVKLEIIGDGAIRGQLEQQAAALNLLANEATNAQPKTSAAGRVEFLGWLSQADCARRLSYADALVLPSVYECGGAVVLEAMAMGIPVVATKWGGPADYLDSSCGILVDPSSREAFITGLAAAMQRLASSPEIRQRMGRAGVERVRQRFDWDAKVDRILEIYGQAIAAADRPTVSAPIDLPTAVGSTPG
jgi:glycosyltransferase involved in cell wall biosynthesis